MKEEIPMLNELIDAFEAGEISENEESYFTFYPTEHHRKSKSHWWMPYSELKAHSQFRKDTRKAQEDFERFLWWGK